VLIATVLISGTNLLAAAAEAHRRFFWSAIQGLPFNLIMIVAAVVFGLDTASTPLPSDSLLVPQPGCCVSSCPFMPEAAAARIVGPEGSGLPLDRQADSAVAGGSALGNANTMVDRAVGSMVGEELSRR
jgi:putative peptidoglycan lipid II flippase